MNTLLIALLKKFGGSEGGGSGDSDFAIANVTFTDSTSSQDVFKVGVNLPYIYADESYGEIISGVISPVATSPYSVEVPLYKGKSIMYIGVEASEIKTTVESGDAEVILEDGYDTVVIRGDCEITFSDPT